MVWKTSNLFSGIPCPEIGACTLISCMFSHDLQSCEPTPHDNEWARSAEQTSIPKVTKPDTPKIQPLRQTAVTQSPSYSGSKPPDVVDKVLPKTLKRNISPPAVDSPLNIERPAKLPRSQPPSLNPRLVPKAPVQHDKRTVVLKALHAELVKKNQAISLDQSNGTEKVIPSLSQYELILAALQEEENSARAEGSNYMNAMRSQIRQFKTMTRESWCERIAKLLPEKLGISRHIEIQADDRKDGDLTHSQEVQILQHLLASDLPSMAPFGYISEIPTEAQVAEASAAVTMSQNYESCERCSARFQVFPTRDDTGRLTTNGPCHFHPERPQRPPSLGKGQSHLAGSGTHQSVHPCCNEPPGSRGCSQHAHHVFKTTSIARMAALLQFIPTPPNPQPAKDHNNEAVDAIAFDCEMGYTTLGYEVVRLTAVTWPEGKCLIDILVRPFGIVLDFNTRFSGVSQHDFDRARPYKPGSPRSTDTQGTDATSLMLADSPAHAREILCSYLTPTTPLIGHAIENDLNIIRLCHPKIVDTVLLYPHRLKLPYRQRLRHLAKTYLGRDIQNEGSAAGHDSLEDSIATGELVRVKVREKWKSLSKKGWKMVEGKLTGPPGSSSPVSGENDPNVDRPKIGEPTLAEYLAMGVEGP